MKSAGRSKLRDLVRGAGCGPVWCDGHEIVRQIFVTARDRRWQETPPVQFESAVDESAGAVTMKARHTNDQLDFEWRGALHVSPDMRSFRFAIEGRALRDMEVCRLGLVVLHPVESLVGSRVAAVSREAEHRFTVASAIAPQPVDGGVPRAMSGPFSELLVERPDFGRLDFRFEGDLFEIEDQRNWGDASFKTYCTPLRLRFPRTVPAGTAIVQSVAIRFVAASVHQGSQAAGGTVRAGARRGVFPALGREWSAEASRVPPARGDLRWQHLHVGLAAPEDHSALATLLETDPGVKVELAADAETPPSAELIALASKHPRRISRVLLQGAGISCPSAAAIERWRRHFGDRGASRIPLLAVVRGYYVELNRGAPFDAAVEGVAFPLTATVHSDDANTIADNVVAIGDMAETARLITGLSEVLVTPLALYYPASPSPRNFPANLSAPWLAATLIHAALARITSITLAADVLGAVESGSSDQWSFLPRLMECSGCDVTLPERPLPCGVHAALFSCASGSPAGALVANLTSRPAVLSLFAGQGEAEVPASAARWIGSVRPSS